MLHAALLLGLAALLAVGARADTLAWCYDDQVLGLWTLQLSDEDVESRHDTVSCPANFTATRTKHIRLLSPNVAIDEETGASGTFSLVYAQAVQIMLGGRHYSFYLAWDELSADEIHTMCWKSQPGMGWSSEEGVAPRFHACLRANLTEPEVSVVDNYHKPGEPGPVNPDAAAERHPLLPGRRLPAPVPTGETYRRLKAEGKLTYRPLGTRNGFSHRIFERLNREAENEARSRGAPLRSIPYQGDKLPERFDWRNVGGRSYVPAPMDQESCGSCFTFATVLAMMARVMVASDLEDPLGQDVLLSVEHALDCNFYSQGCSGGFGEHVVRFAEQFGILTEDAYYIDYESGDGVLRECKTPDDGAFLSSAGSRYFFTAGQLLGGYLGAVTDPTEMKWEVYRHGPMTVSVQANDNFRKCMHYDGVPKSAAGADAGASDAAEGDVDPERHHFIQEVNHLVVIIGWDVLENGTEVWLVQNSWGPGYCDNGVIRVAMGSNEYAIETEPLTFYWWPKGPVYRDHGFVEITHASYVALYAVLGVLLTLVIALAVTSAVCAKKNSRKARMAVLDPMPGEAELTRAT